MRPAIAAAVTLLALLAVVLDFPPELRGPAPYPPEWQWERRAAPAPGPWWPAWGCAIGLVGLVALADRARSRRGQRAVLAAGTIAGAGLGLALLAVEPGGALQTAARRALSRTVTSYLTLAASDDARDPIEFLRNHASALPRYHKEAKHAATHPPGPVLFYRGLIAIAEAAPGLARATLRFAQMREEAARPGAPGLSARAAAVWGPMLIIVAAAMTAWPVTALARSLGLEEVAATRAGLLWLLVPGPLLQAPQFDQALALPVAVAAMALASAARCSGPSALGLAMLAGLAGSFALFFSYGSAVPLAISCAAALVALGDDRRRALVLAATAAAVSVGVFASTALLGHAPLDAALTALRIHRDAYTTQRSYPLWLLFNPIDLFVFLGPAVAALLPVRHRASDEPGRFAVATLGGLALLLACGVVRGEAGRILIPLMPALLLAAVAPNRAALLARPAALLASLLAAWSLTLRAFWEIY